MPLYNISRPDNLYVHFEIVEEGGGGETDIDLSPLQLLLYWYYILLLSFHGDVTFKSWMLVVLLGKIATVFQKNQNRLHRFPQ